MIDCPLTLPPHNRFQRFDTIAITRRIAAPEFLSLSQSLVQQSFRRHVPIDHHQVLKSPSTTTPREEKKCNKIITIIGRSIITERYLLGLGRSRRGMTQPIPASEKKKEVGPTGVTKRRFAIKLNLDKSGTSQAPKSVTGLNPFKNKKFS